MHTHHILIALIYTNLYITLHTTALDINELFCFLLVICKTYEIAQLLFRGSLSSKSLWNK